MPLMQEDIRQHYEQAWKQVDDTATDDAGLMYSSPVEDTVMYPLYERLLRDMNVRVDDGKVLDVGSGSGRWIRFFTQRFSPGLLKGIDFTQASIELLARRYVSDKISFQTADLCNPALALHERFDLINVMNVLFHIPEQERFMAAMKNLAKHLAPGGKIVTTEYMPRSTMRTNWMLVRSRYEFEQLAASVGLRIAEIRAHSFFSNDPMGLDGPENGVRGQFHVVRAAIQQLRTAGTDAASKQFFHKLLCDLESCLLHFCRERMAEVDLPSQKLVVLCAA